MNTRAPFFPFAASLLLACAPAWADPAAEIISLTGSGDWRSDAASEWQPARIQLGLEAGNFVRTSQLSKLALMFRDHTQVKVGSASTVRIRGVAAAGGTSAELQKGRLWGQTKEAPPGGISIRTPSATAAIRGTEWALEVDETGRTVLTVLEGVVQLANEQGSVTVLANEEGVAAIGRAPIKRTLVRPKERVQWVASYRFPATRYPELAAPRWKELAERLAAGDFAEASRILDATPAGEPLVTLLRAELALANGDGREAQAIAEGSPGTTDPRHAALLAEALMLQDEGRAARALLERAPRDVETLLARGELERLDGDGEGAARSFADAAASVPGDPRAWLGRGRVATEREDYAQARAWLTQALALAPEEGLAESELGQLETLASRVETARSHFRRAIERAPDDYVSLTGLGLLELKAGDPEKALDHLRRATAIAPDYARAPLYTAAAYYQLGRTQAALDTLERAARLDPNDPLPYFFETLIRQDELDPAGAIRAAREAQARLPYLKSPNQIANDRQGSANLGASYALFGLEEWALREAHRSFLPFWAGSHLFLADRLADDHAQRSELIQGFLTDPTVFGASPLRQSLVPTPNQHLSVGVRLNEMEAVRTGEGVVTASAYGATPVPVAAFAEVIQTEVRPKEERLDASAPSATIALGAKVTPELGLFLYADRFEPRMHEVELPQPSRVRGELGRVDLGASYRSSPDAQSWLKLGQGREDSIVDRLNEPYTRSWTRDEQEAAWRTTWRVAGVEWSAGLEGGEMERPERAVKVGTLNQSENLKRLEERSSRGYLSGRWASNPAWLVQADLDYVDLDARLHRSGWSIPLDGSAPLPLSTKRERRESAEFYPRIGVAYSPDATQTYRFAAQHYRRPVGSASLAPVETAGISLDVPGLLSGGELKRARLQGEWELSPATFVIAFADHKEVRNLHEGVVAEPFDAADAVVQYDRLRQQALTRLLMHEYLEADPIFAEGKFDTAGVTGNFILSERLSASASYIHTEQENLIFPDKSLPYMPRHRVGFGMSWFGPDRWFHQGRLVWRSERVSTQGGDGPLDADWDLAFRSVWQSNPKDWLFEGYVANLLREDESWIVGAQLLHRF